MRFLIAALLLIPCLAGAAEQRMTHDGESRRYFLEAPRGARPAPAIFVLHGGVTVPSRMRRITHFTLDEQGWAEVYPVAVGDRWIHRQAIADDIGFLRALIGKLAGQGLIDPERVFFAGAADGGAMVLRVICEAPELVAGAALVSITMPEALDCPDGPPLPLLFIHGTADPLVPFAGGRVAGVGGGRYLSAAETVARFARRNGCGHYDPIAITDHYPDDGTRVTLHAYRGCTAPLRHYIVEGGGHPWPGNRVSRLVERHLGRTSRDISATFEIESFFAAQLRR